MIYKLAFNVVKYCHHLLFARYKIHRAVIDESGMIFIEYVSLVNGKIFTGRIDDFFSSQGKLNAFDRMDCVKIGFLGAGKLFMTKDQMSGEDIRKKFKDFVTEMNSASE